MPRWWNQLLQRQSNSLLIVVSWQLWQPFMIALKGKILVCYFNKLKGFPMFCKHSFSMPCSKEVTCHWQRIEISIRALLYKVMLEYTSENYLSLQLERSPHIAIFPNPLLENDKASPQYCHGLNLTLYVHIVIITGTEKVVPCLFAFWTHVMHAHFGL